MQKEILFYDKFFIRLYMFRGGRPFKFFIRLYMFRGGRPPTGLMIPDAV